MFSRILLVMLQLTLAAATTIDTNVDNGGVHSKHNNNKPTIKRVGVVVSDGFELLDALGPFEALKEVQEHYYRHIDIEKRIMDTNMDSGIRCSNGDLEVEAVLASFQTDTVVSSSGLSMNPQFDLSQDPEATRFDLLVLGHGAMDVTDPTAMAYVQKHHSRGGSILTVCTASRFPAALGLLDGAEATSNSLVLDRYRQAFPTVRWVSLADNLERRFVHSTDRIITTAGITAGIDGILYLIEEWCGGDVAEATRQCLEWPLSIQQQQQQQQENESAAATTTTCAACTN